MQNFVGSELVEIPVLVILIDNLAIYHADLHLVSGKRCQTHKLPRTVPFNERIRIPSKEPIQPHRDPEIMRCHIGIWRAEHLPHSAIPFFLPIPIRISAINNNGQRRYCFRKQSDA